MTGGACRAFSDMPSAQTSRMYLCFATFLKRRHTAHLREAPAVPVGGSGCTAAMTPGMWPLRVGRGVAGGCSGFLGRAGLVCGRWLIHRHWLGQRWTRGTRRQPFALWGVAAGTQPAHQGFSVNLCHAKQYHALHGECNTGWPQGMLLHVVHRSGRLWDAEEAVATACSVLGIAVDVACWPACAWCPLAAGATGAGAR